MQIEFRKLIGVFLLFAISIGLISYAAEQSDFIFSLIAYSIAFITFLYFLIIRNEFSLKLWKRVAFILFLIPLFSIPSLSPDVYRFLWDGELVTMGIHPYAFTPNELMQVDPSIYDSAYMNLLYEKITPLSQGNYSIYPSVNQLYFLIPALISNHLLLSLIVLRLLILLTLIVGAHYLFKILDLLSIPMNNGLFLILNPILIVEVMGNFHFEGVLLSWLMIGIYFMLKHSWFKSSLFWAIAINIKLTPLILLPFLLRFQKLKTNLIFYFSTILFSGSLLLIYLWPSVFWNFMQSIELYFNNFEFNASIFYALKWISSFFIEGNPTLIIGPALSVMSFLSILFIAFYKPIKTSKELLNRMMWGYAIYLLLATTVHPWYVILPLGLAVFSMNLGVLFWSYLIFLSYGFYAFGGTGFGGVLIGLEYVVLIWILVFPNSPILKLVGAKLNLNAIPYN